MAKRIRAYEFKPGEPPAEIQLWNVGDNPTDYGVHRWTERSAREVMARYESRGNPLQIDIDHNCADEPDPASPPPTGGYARLELREGAPWLVFDWSAYAIEQIATRQRLFLSPEYFIDEKTKEIIALIRVSLVGSPGTHNARMLASAKRVRAGGKQMDPTLLAALKAVLEAEDPKQALANLIAELEKAPEGDAAPDPEPQAAEGGTGDDPDKQAAEGAEPDDDPDKDKPVAAKSKKPASLSQDDTIKLAQRVAALEDENRRIKVEARIAAAGDRIPESLRAFAKTLDLDALEKLIAGLPEPKTRGVRASSKPARGDSAKVDEPAGELPEEDAKEMDRIFGNAVWREQSITKNGTRIQASHLAKKGS